ncbi:nuclear transport factor 2 family protein [Thiomicrospira sp. ALE5]|uniref:nuclear transport factor 2 family protein n=1 Tax=Thiomicrospira sp. ALE5 TaxID=748650 RepID=UPI0008E35FCE|nr:nuclear transport factor 2 family protein [Thiomicrospira sp. ALE5]SFR62829.1 SnoaL-like domain-containing protein [Thiomicrospira sp. ALE5]
MTQQYYELTEKSTKSIKARAPLTLEQVLSAYQTLFENLDPQTMAQAFSEVFAPQVYFKDPFNEIKGRAKLLALFEHMFTTLHEPMFRIHHKAGSGNTGYLEWRFYFKLKPNQPVKQINGMSKIVIDDQGWVIVHIDYWDSGEYIYHQVPIIGAFTRWVASKLKADV